MTGGNDMQTSQPADTAPVNSQTTDIAPVNEAGTSKARNPAEQTGNGNLTDQLDTIIGLYANGDIQISITSHQLSDILKASNDLTDEQYTMLHNKYLNRCEQARSHQEMAISHGTRGDLCTKPNDEGDACGAPGHWQTLLAHAFRDPKFGGGPEVGERRPREDDGDDGGPALK